VRTRRISQTQICKSLVPGIFRAPYFNAVLRLERSNRVRACGRGSTTPEMTRGERCVLSNYPGLTGAAGQ
jgi:hypothetical protein